MLKHLVWMAFILCLCLAAKSFYIQEQINKGKAISHYLKESQNMDIPPEDARWLKVDVTQYDVNFKDVDVFMPNLK